MACEGHFSEVNCSQLRLRCFEEHRVGRCEMCVRIVISKQTRQNISS